MTLDKYGYPTKNTLEQIGKFNFDKKFKNIDEFIILIYQHWWYPDCGFKYDNATGILQLHTLGWSGNENIILALKDNYLFWEVFWCESKRGGHYRFKLFKFDDDDKTRITPVIKFETGVND